MLKILFTVLALSFSLCVYGEMNISDNLDSMDGYTEKNSENNKEPDPTEIEKISKDVALYITGNECGPLSVAAILKYWGEDIDLTRIKKLTGYNYKTGTNISGIRKALESYDYKTFSVKLNYSLLCEIINYNIPAIVGYGETHIAVVLPPTDKGEILLIDPLRLHKSYVKSNIFCQHWDKMAVFVYKNDSVNPKHVVEKIKNERLSSYVSIASIPLSGAVFIFILRLVYKRKLYQKQKK